MLLESPLLVAVRKYKVGKSGAYLGAQRHFVILEDIRPHAVGAVVLQGLNHSFGTVGSEQYIIVKHQDAVAVDFVVLERPLGNHAFPDINIFFVADLEFRPFVPLGDICYHPLGLHALPGNRLQLPAELVSGGAEGADGYGVADCH